MQVEETTVNHQSNLRLTCSVRVLIGAKIKRTPVMTSIDEVKL